METAAYRIIQEALTNAARHAAAGKVEVWVAVDPEGMAIQIEDDGRGFDYQSALASGKANGLVGIRERAMLLGGSFKIQSNPGQGTRLVVAIPCEALEVISSGKPA